ncbi:MAG TPA: fimbria/pilus outer membrane usher protein [Acetobacteraceae bacterium]|nr:fimbria/pilus outer membrane usher protein [Acetobacteraceae bacterium]
MLLAAALLLAMPAARAAEPAQTLLLKVVINGRPTSRIGAFTDRRGVLYATPRELRGVGFRLPRTAGTGPVALGSLPGVSYRIDMPMQRLLVTAADESLSPTLIGGSARNPDAAAAVQSATGGALDYSIVGTSLARQTIVSGLFDGRLFTPYGVAGSGFLADMGTGLDQTVRLGSTYTYSDPATLRRYRAGDVISGGLSWTRPVRLGGVQITTDFSMRPDLVTFPVPRISGQVAVPSAVDVLVNGIRQFSGNVPPGPFQVQQLPVVTGAGTVSVVVTDALGQQTTQTLPFYASTQLLAPGLDDYSFEAGAVRLDYGVRSDDYRDMAGSASFRHGVSSWLTLEGHAEATPGLFMGGAGAAIDVGNLGVLSFSAAGSAAGGRGGWQFGVRIERVTPVVSFAASTLISSRGFRDIAAMNADPVPRVLTQASAGLSLGRFGSFGVAYTGIERDAFRTPQPFVPAFDAGVGGLSAPGYLVPAQHVQLITASYTKPLFGNIVAYATG